MKLSKEEKDALSLAAVIIKNKLADGEEIEIPKFGKFYVNKYTADGHGPNCDADTPLIINKVYFRPFLALKKAVQE